MITLNIILCLVNKTIRFFFSGTLSLFCLVFFLCVCVSVFLAETASVIDLNKYMHFILMIWVRGGIVLYVLVVEVVSRIG